MSRTADGNPPNGTSHATPAISANGRVIAFTSWATNLVAGDTNDRLDVFVYDRNLGTVERVSVSSFGAQANDESYEPAVSADGRYVAFSSKASNLVPGDTNANPSYCCSTDVFVHDRVTDQTERVSVTTDGQQGFGHPWNSYATRPSISADGRHVAFYTDFGLDPGDGGLTADVYVRDRTAGTTRWVSDPSDGSSGAFDPEISADGSSVAFRTSRRMLAADTNSFQDVYVRRLGDHSLVLASVGDDESQATDHLDGAVDISSDGRLVAFSSSSAFVAGDTNGNLDVFVRDLTAGTTERVSVGAGNRQVSQSSADPVISDDGRFVNFLSSSPDGEVGLVPGFELDSVGFVRDRAGNRTTALRRQEDFQRFWLGPDGRTAVFATSEPGLPGVYDREAESVFLTEIDWDDVTRPDTTVPDRMEVAAQDGAGAEVRYEASATDDSGFEPPVECLPASGSAFPLGTTTVRCYAADESGNEADASFEVVVSDQTAPSFSHPERITLDQNRPDGAVVVFASPQPAYDETDGYLEESCDHDSGDVFPVGTTLVECTATDSAGNSATARFDVVVRPAPVAALSIADLRISEDRGSAYVQLSLGAPAGADTTVQWATANGTASSPRDFDAQSGTATFPAGARYTTVWIPWRNDARDEPDEDFHVRVDGSAAGLPDVTGTITLVDDDEPIPNRRGTVNGPLVYAGGDEDHGRLLAVDPASGQVRTLAERDGSGFGQPTVSPDGRKVAFTGSEGLEEVDIAGGTPRPVVFAWDDPYPPDQVENLAWRPDGEAFAFTSGHLEGRPDSQLWLIEDGNARVVGGMRGENIQGLSWAPDGQRLVYSRSVGFGSERNLAIFDLADGTIEPLTGADDCREQAPSWSPDGQTIVFEQRCVVSSEDGTLGLQSIAVIPATGGSRQVLAAADPSQSFRDEDPVWSPDGARIGFWRMPDEGPDVYGWDGEIWSIAADGTGAQRHAGSPNLGSEVDWASVQPASDEGLIAFTASGSGGSRNVGTIRADGGGRRLVTDTGHDSQPDLSATGAGIVFASDRDGPPAAIWRMRSDGRRPTRLTEPAADSAPAYSPDATRVAFARLDPSSGTTDIYVANADGSGTVERLTSAFGNDTDPAWSPDGTRIAFSSERIDAGDIYVMNADGSAEERLTEGAAADSDPDFSPTGDQIAFARSTATSSRIHTVPTAGGSSRELGDGSQDARSPSYSPDGRSIAYAGPGGLWKMTADGALPEQLTDAGETEPSWGAAPLPLPTLSVADASIGEGNSGTARASFALTLSRVTDEDVTVRFSTGAGSADPALDYAPVTDQLVTIPAGATTAAVTVDVHGDEIDEPDETIPVTLADPDGATLGDGSGTGTIVDDDPTPALAIGDVTVAEGDAGEVDATFAVQLSRASGFTVTADFATVQGSAFAGDDYVARSGTVSLAPGETTATVTVKVRGDTLDEPDQQFFVDLASPQHATLADARGTATIVDDDGSLDLPETQLTGGPDGLTNDPTPVFSFRASTSDATFECRIDGGSYSPCRSGDETRPLSDGSHTFEVRAISASGGADATPESRAFTIDTVAPGTTIALAPPRATNDNTPTFTIRSGEAGAAIECHAAAGAGGGESWANCGEQWTSPPLADGEYTFEARARDRAGNVDPTPATYTFTVDTSLPDTALGSSQVAPAAEDELRNLAPTATGTEGGGTAAVSPAGHTVLQVSCPALARYGCRGAMLLMDGDRILARAAYDVPAGGSLAIDVALPVAVINRIEREGSMEVLATASTQPAGLPKGRAGGAPRVNGAGQKLVLRADPRSPRIRDAGRDVSPRRGVAGIRLTCPADHGRRCRGRLVLERRGGGALGRASFDLAPRATRTLRVRLTRTARARLQRLGRIAAFVRLDTRQPGGKPVRKRVEITLTARRAR